MDAEKLKNEISKIISSFKSSSYVELEILKATKQAELTVMEGWYEAGIFGERTPFRISLDSNYNVIEVDLTGRQAKS